MVEASFLTAGPRVSLELPLTLDPRPSSEAPVDIGEGRGSRTFAWTPLWMDEASPANHTEIRRQETSEGSVAVYEAGGDIKQWVIRWELADGWLNTHVRGFDGYPRVEMVLESVSIGRCGGMPCLGLVHPLRNGVAARPGYAELITFFNPAVRTGAEITTGLASLQLARPGRLRAGARYAEGNGDNQHLHYRGTRAGIDVFIAAAGDALRAEAVADAAADSIATG